VVVDMVLRMICQSSALMARSPLRIQVAKRLRTLEAWALVTPARLAR